MVRAGGYNRVYPRHAVPAKRTPPLTILEALGLGALQGVTEFLPISSSGHLVLAQELLKIKEPPLPFVVLLHAGSLLAILLYFRREIVSVFTTRRHLIVPLIIGTIPAGLGYLLLKKRLEAMFENPVGVGVGLLVTGTVLIAAERLATDRRSLDEVRGEDGFWIGIAQTIALVPGISRCGMTVGAGLASGFERAAAVAFAFLLGLVAIGGATVAKLKDIAAMGSEAGWGALAAGFVASAIVSLGALVLLTVVVNRKRLAWFAIYCYAVGVAVLLAKLFGAW